MERESRGTVGTGHGLERERAWNGNGAGTVDPLNYGERYTFGTLNGMSVERDEGNGLL